MNRGLRAFSWILILLLFVRGIDYVTGDTVSAGSMGHEEDVMPLYWGWASIVVAVAAAAATFLKDSRSLQNIALVGFAINLMFAIQVADMRMSPVPWPPEDIRTLVDHLGRSAMWLCISFTLWWRSGVVRRRNELVESGV